MKIKITYLVMGRYEDDSEEMFMELDSYEEAESYIIETTYVAEEFWIRKVYKKALEKIKATK